MNEKIKLQMLRTGTTERIIRNLEKKQAYYLIKEIADLNETTFDNVIDALNSNVVRCELSNHIAFIKKIQEEEGGVNET